MTSAELINYIERKFEKHGVRKIIPDDDILEQHARRMIERQLIRRELDRLLPQIHKQVAATELPEDLRERVAELLKEDPQLPWDAAVSEIAGNIADNDEDEDDEE